MKKLKLPTVTLCAVTSVNSAATIAALQACLEQIAFADCLLLTNAEVVPPEGIRAVPIAPLDSAHAYSDFMLQKLSDHIRTDHCLIVQWDGFVLNAHQWDPAFLTYDYIGSPWPQFHDGHDVGNGGFSLRSRKLLEACRDPRFEKGHAEDLAICRHNRSLLEREHDIRFADRATAERFAFERTTPAGPTFGFHGVFNMVPTIGRERFWAMYRTLDDPSTAFVDYGRVMRQLGGDREALSRRIRLTRDWLSSLFRR